MDTARGTLSNPVDHATFASGTNEQRGGDIAITADGKFVYATNRQRLDLAIFAVDQTTGRLTLTANQDVLNDNQVNRTITQPSKFDLSTSRQRGKVASISKAKA